MKRLALLRHAKAEPGDRGNDHERRLAERGRRDAPVMGRAIAAAGWRPELILCSTARRTAETLELVLAQFAPSPRVMLEPALYHAEAATILERVARVEESVGSVLVIGHNPGLEELALHLAGDTKLGRRIETGFVTAAFAAFESEAATWRAAANGAWTPDVFFRPADLG